jgi:hypothetical protein
MDITLRDRYRGSLLGNRSAHGSPKSPLAAFDAKSRQRFAEAGMLLSRWRRRSGRLSAGKILPRWCFGQRIWAMTPTAQVRWLDSWRVRFMASVAFQ